MAIIQLHAPITDTEKKIKYYGQIQFEIKGICKQVVCLLVEHQNTKPENIEENVNGCHGVGN